MPLSKEKIRNDICSTSKKVKIVNYAVAQGKKNVNQMNEKTKIPQKNLELFAIQKGPSGN